VVVVVGDTVMDVPVTVPIPWLIERVSASVTDQFKVELPPAVIPGGLAVNELIVGLVGGIQLKADNTVNNKIIRNIFKEKL